MIKDKQCCGKKLKVGDRAVNRWGRVLCLDCDRKYKAPYMAVYTEGELLISSYCGEVLLK